MNEIKDALLRMIRSAMSIKKMADAYLEIGWDDSRLHQVYGDVLDAVYSLIGEQVDDFEQSVTWLAATAPILTDERRMELLYSEYERNHPDQVKQPKPHTFTQEEMQRLTTMNGGYMTPEGDWQ